MLPFNLKMAMRNSWTNRLLAEHNYNCVLLSFRLGYMTRVTSYCNCKSK